MKTKPLLFLITAVAAMVLIFAVTACKEEEEEILPRVRTNEVKEVSSSTALLGGTIIDQGSHPIISQGICYSSNNNYPTLLDNWIFR